tara:strand:- start:160 stop:354 length:195 start_codon:yes stop_codon:yes gene_type:complete
VKFLKNFKKFQLIVVFLLKRVILFTEVAHICFFSELLMSKYQDNPMTKSKKEAPQVRMFRRFFK